MENRPPSKSGVVLSDPSIPTRLVIGVTGHRKLGNQPALTEAVHSALKNIEQFIPPLRSTPRLFCVLSALAEGADRLVATEVLKLPGASLEVVLPLERDGYKKDFKTAASKKEFEALLKKAKNVRVLPSVSSRNESYERAGRYVVDHCDILIALWDGKPAGGRGGTQEIVEYARKTGRPLVWINTERPSKIEFENWKPGNKTP